MVPKCFGNPAVAKKVQSVGAFMIEILHLHRLNRLPVIIVVRFLIVNKKQEYNSYPLTTSSAIWRAAAFLLNAAPSIGTSRTSTHPTANGQKDGGFAHSCSWFSPAIGCYGNKAYIHR